MGLLEILLLLLVAGVCGSIAQAIVGYSHGGCLVSIVLGLIGALLGTYLAGKLGMGDFLAINFNGKTFPIVWSIIGATLFVAVLSLFTRRRPMV
ncbi:GlsB/YeaQ/YmgE family stress response membrane protein [Anatilimnocola sp. NA78]|uniref:GlsB/YeaQ/YmgE family stress response membrane protein n=1 Tax=Anatilimnocola sp. NA78 TaxID=3415683 RepID=UPI003CE4881E